MRFLAQLLLFADGEDDDERETKIRNKFKIEFSWQWLVVSVFVIFCGVKLNEAEDFLFFSCRLRTSVRAHLPVNSMDFMSRLVLFKIIFQAHCLNDGNFRDQARTVFYSNSATKCVANLKMK